MKLSTLPGKKTIRVILIGLALIVLLITYIFQGFNFLAFFERCVGVTNASIHPNLTFIFNRTSRLLINDTACMVLIISIFHEPKYVRFGFKIFLFEILVLLPLYFLLKLSIEGDSEISSPLLSQVHRMIVNPTLMVLVMVAFVYQKFKGQRHA